MPKSKDRMPPKTVVIGLDGVPYGLLTDLMSKGYLKNMEFLFKNGSFGQMEASIPEISSVSWSSFMTGTQPGKHGIFGFTDLIPNSYLMTFQTRTLFDELGEKGKRSVVINLPATYPARQIPGVLISGFVAMDINKAVYPQALIPKLQGMNYSIDIDLGKARQDHEFLISDLHRTLHSRERAVDYLWEKEDWDLFMLVITGTDRINHFLWDAYVNPDYPYHQDFITYYQKVDQFVGRYYQKYMSLPGSQGALNHFLLLSDHGFTAIHSEVYLNRWLQENGFLFFTSDQPKSIEEISDQSKAFVMDPSRIYIHKKGRYPRGNVDPGDVSTIKDEIRGCLKELKFNDGSDVIKKIYDRAELYHGPQTADGPDMVLLSHAGFDLKGKINNDSIFGRTVLQGMHTQNDAVFYSDKGKRPNTIFDLKEIILNNY
jgi:predicted AlkP superfamily phosphohydrolase/phosphomutase